MARTYVIAWESQRGSRCGQGKKFFAREEAINLVNELNRDYPDFVHRTLNLNAESISVELDSSAIIEVDFSTPRRDRGNAAEEPA